MHPTAKILATPMFNQTVSEIELLQVARILCRAFLIMLIYAKMCDWKKCANSKFDIACHRQIKQIV